MDQDKQVKKAVEEDIQQTNSFVNILTVLHLHMCISVFSTEDLAQHGTIIADV